MMALMTQKEFIEKHWFVLEQKTLYATGAFGAPLTQHMKDRYKVSAPVDPNRYLFDCCGLQKSILWGFRADPNATYGGAEYKKDEIYCYWSGGKLCEYSDSVINGCYDVSTDFSKIEPGECVWIPGHVGTYIGNGLVIECTAAWEGCVMLTACNRDIEGFHRRNWKKHGKLPWIKYEKYIEPVFTYQTFDLPKEKWLPLVTNLSDYAGIFGEAVSAIRATPSIGKLEYWSRSDPEQWFGGTYNGATSGTTKHAILAFMARYDKSQAHYRVKTNEWLPVVSGCNPGDSDKGYAGDDKNPITAIYIWADPIFEDEPADTSAEPSEATSEPTETPAETTAEPSEEIDEPSKMSKIKKWIMRFLRWILKFFEEEDEK